MRFEIIGMHPFAPRLVDIPKLVEAVKAARPMCFACSTEFFYLLKAEVRALAALKQHLAASTLPSQAAPETLREAIHCVSASAFQAEAQAAKDTPVARDFTRDYVVDVSLGVLVWGFWESRSVAQFHDPQADDVGVAA